MSAPGRSRQVGLARPPFPRRPRRRLAGGLFRAATAACAVGGGLTLTLLFAFLLRQGLSALDWGYLTGAGGIRYQILGTLLLIATALAVAVPLATAVALAVTVYVRRAVARRLLVDALYLLNGVPSIVFGLIGLAFFVRFLGWGKSWLGGGLVLALMILPTLSVALVERLEAVPAEYHSAARALGLDRTQVVWSVLLPQSAAGLVSGSLLGLARAAGETAPIMFVAAVFSGVTLPDGVSESPVLALPYHVFVLAQDTFSVAARAEMWAAAFVLVALVLCLSLAALPFRAALHEEARHG